MAAAHHLLQGVARTQEVAVLVRGTAAAVRSLPGLGRFRIRQLILDLPVDHRRRVEEFQQCVLLLSVGIDRHHAS